MVNFVNNSEPDITAENLNKMQTDLKSLIDNLWKTLYPVGSVKMTTVNKNPQTYLGGKWVAWGSGRVPVGVNASDTDFNTVEKTGGEKTHKLTTSELPTFTPTLANGGTTIAINATNYDSGLTENGFMCGANSWWAGSKKSLSGFNSIGGNTAHNNLQPYITCYMWKRTA